MKILDFTKLAKLKANSLNSDGEVSRAEVLFKAANWYGEGSNIVAVAKDEFAHFAKGEIGAGSTLGGWGQPLSAYSAASAVFYDAIIEASLLGRLPIPRIPARTPIMLGAEEAEAHWVAVGDPIPVTALDFSRSTLELLRLGLISVQTKELLSAQEPDDMITFERITGSELGKTSPLTARAIQMTIDHIDEIYGRPDQFRSQRFAAFIAAAVGSQIEAGLIQSLLMETALAQRVTELEARLAQLEGAVVDWVHAPG
jgi:hypothetical protein